MPRAEARPASRESSVLTNAAVRAADKLDLKNVTLARILGVSPPSVTRMKRGEYFLDPDTKEFEIGAMFVRMFRSLDSIVSGDEAVARQWLRNPNTALGHPPIELIQTLSGLNNVINYLDARRAIT